MLRKQSKIIEQLFDSAENISEKKYTSKLIKDLPKPVQRYFNYSLTENQPFVSFVRLIHGGKFKPKYDWVNIKGEEYFTADKPGFVWIGKTALFLARDSYINGNGNLQVKLLSLLKIVDAKGEEYNQGELLRWLGEAPLFPTALLPSEKLIWEAIDDTSAKVHFQDSGIEIDCIFHFNNKGQIMKLEAKRFMETSIEDWIGYYDNYRKINNMMIPHKMKVEWNLSTGVHEYVDFDVEKIEFNIPEKF